VIRTLSDRTRLKRTSSTGATLRKICHCCLLDKKKYFYAKKEWMKRTSRRCKNCQKSGKNVRATTDKEADALRAAEEIKN